MLTFMIKLDKQFSDKEHLKNVAFFLRIQIWS